MKGSQGKLGIFYDKVLDCIYNGIVLFEGGIRLVVHDIGNYSITVNIKTSIIDTLKRG